MSNPLHFPRVLGALARLFCYPTEETVQAAELLFVLLQEESPEASRSASEFGAYLEPRHVHDLEENYSRTFDINPACALEIGWHLFGEEYARGLFLVRLRGEMQLRGLEESAELPDHITHVLGVVAEMDHDEAQRFVQACVLPAVDKMLEKLDEAESPYRHVAQCLTLVLEQQFGRAEPSDDESAAATGMPESEGDPLRDYPGPGRQCDSVEFVPLQINYNHEQALAGAPDGVPAGGCSRPDDSIPFMLRDQVRHGGHHE